MGHDELHYDGGLCTVHEGHVPVPYRAVRHHIWPQEYGGPTVPENLVTVCDTGHYNIHQGIWLLQHGREPFGTDAEQALARLGFDRLTRHAL